MSVREDTDTAKTVTDAALRPFLGFNLRRAWNVIHADLTATLEPHDLRMITFSALAVIGDNPGLSQAQLATALSVERPNLVPVTDELASRGLVTRERVPSDRRTYALRLTASGASLLARATTAVHDHESALYADLGEADRATLIAAFRRIESTGTGRS
ncbi:MarR family transcriptional regulator [Maritimibacter sp. UBA3975]|uniref:MarR family winged helix-turn-helix transcriptional regulator n=1 Tax=Maritimibacter sp. UBA3975 TaxID=1946833 RepID=UPI000C0A1284|nr:MarR family transcriptional regulator [Maritimibacter sp. UBA3975]MAM63135.1 MarR family transcriptional regulator [Maritimibacter sp.]|tara:strand:+ start:2859 stop:3332 length:474 start_codon:yes stop_codon:yes gene_type:complete